MRNPVRELLRMIEAWSEAESLAADGERGLKTDDGIDKHIAVMRCLWEIQTWLHAQDAAGAETESYWRTWRKVARTVAVYPGGWRNSDPNRPHQVRKETIADLRLMARELDLLPDAYTETADLLLSLKEWVSGIRDLAEADSELPEVLSKTLIDLSDELLDMMSGVGSSSPAEFHERLRWLWLAVYEAARAGTARGGFWRRAGDQGMGFITGLISNGAYAQIAQLASGIQ